MASVQRPGSSGSDSDPRYAMVDEKKRKRMVSNRESAKRSRMRKQKQLEDLINESSTLENEIKQLSQSISIISERHNDMEAANDVLRAEKMKLTEQLRSLNSVLHIAEDVNGMSVDIDIPEVPDCLMEPWQLPCPMQPIMASAEMFQC